MGHEFRGHDQSSIAQGVLEVLEVIVAGEFSFLNANASIHRDRFHPIRCQIRHVECHCTTHGKAEQVCAIDPKLIHQGQKVPSMGLGAIVTDPTCRRAESEQVHRNHPIVIGDQGHDPVEVGVLPGLPRIRMSGGPSPASRKLITTGSPLVGPDAAIGATDRNRSPGFGCFRLDVIRSTKNKHTSSRR